jgi:hypothetical protein
LHHQKPGLGMISEHWPNFPNIIKRHLTWY